nr:Crp/Fnr family transcriptional regulator [Flaviflexus equikiangi]
MTCVNERARHAYNGGTTQGRDVPVPQSPVTRSAGEPHQCSIETRLRVLREVRWFADLEDEELIELNGRITSHAWAAGQYIHIEGDAADSLHVIAEGVAKVEKIAPDGTAHIVDIAVAGDLVGVLPQLGDPVYADSVVTLGVTCALRIDANRFSTILRRYPSVTLHVLDDVAGKLARTRHSVTVGTRQVPERLADVLLMLMSKVGRRDREGILIDLPLTRVDIAAMAGSTPESVSRTMSVWKAEGIVDSGRQWTRVLRPDIIRTIATGITRTA